MRMAYGSNSEENQRTADNPGKAAHGVDQNSVMTGPVTKKISLS